jgi:glycosyltransferase involved in cell wall biosynthesis
VDLHFRAFFDLNPRENLFVYYPENYHPDGCVKNFYSYLEQRFDLQKIPVESMVRYPAGFEKKKKKEEINIAYIAPWLIIGGSDSMTIDWFKAMDTPGFRTFFLSTEPRVNAWIYQIRGLSQGIYDLPGLLCKKPEEKIRFILERIEKCQIHVVQVMNSEEGFRALSEIKKKFPRVKTVAQFHCFDYLKNRRKTGFPYSAPARYDPCIDYYNVESYSLKNEIRELYPFIDERKFRVIHACVDTQKYDPDKDDFDENVLNYRHEDKLNILFAGRLDRQKRPMTMVKTAHDLKKKGYPVIFHVLGEGSLHSEERRIRRYIRQNRLYDVVKLHGFQPMDTLPSWYKLADVLLLTSAWEGIPVVLYQAMSMGVVCLAPKMDSICEILDENTGILVENGEDPEEYTRCVIRLLENRDRLKEKGFEARKKMVEHFDVKNMERKYRAFYREIVNEN